MYSQDSIDLLANSGLQFQKHEEEGIDTLHFAELLMTSGVVLCDNVKWLSFHRSVSEDVSLLLWKQGIALCYFWSPLGSLLLLTSSYKVEMVLVAHISVLQKTLWGSYWFE